MILRYILAGALLCVLLQPAYARVRTGHNRAEPGNHRHHFVDATNMVGCADPIMRPCGGALNFQFSSEHQPKALKTQLNRRKKGHLSTTHQNTIRPMPAGLRRVMAEGAGVVVSGRPEGCPRAFCGCGASLYLFGKIVPALNLAANWLRFPRADPAPGMVAARRGHVFVLVRHIRGPIWLAHDSNSGRHRTRVHPRSIVGFAIVNPGAGV